MSSFVYNSALEDEASGRINFDADLFNVMLVHGYLADKKNHTRIADVKGEVSGAGYERGGTSAFVTVSKDNEKDRVDITLGSTMWNPATIKASGAVYYKLSGGELIAFIDFGQDVVSNNGIFALSASTIRLQN